MYNKKRMRPETCFFAALALSFLLLISSREAAAQQPPAVEVDMSVLGIDAPVLHYPATPAKTHQPKTSPSVPLKNSNAMAPQRGIVSFPVEVRERSNAFDPSLGKSPAAPDTAALDKSSQVNNFSPPMLAYKPVMSASRKQDPVMESPGALSAHIPVKNGPNKQIAHAKVPIPPRRPARIEASAAFVQKARRDLGNPPVINIARGDMDMPAVPAAEVHTESLRPLYGDSIKAKSPDHLARQLITPDRLAMVKSVEQVSALANAISAKQDLNPGSAAPRSHPPKPLSKPQIQSTDDVYVSAEVAAALANMEPASGYSDAGFLAQPSAKAAPLPQAASIPRMPPRELEGEQDYISVLFAPGLTEIDQQIITSLDERVLPLLKENANWRLQIQAFAGKEAGGDKNARRASLARALSVRTHLMKNGIQAHRMDVRALGMQTDRSPADRVDFVFFDPQTVN